MCNICHLNGKSLFSNTDLLVDLMNLLVYAQLPKVYMYIFFCHLLHLMSFVHYECSFVKITTF